jgi:hypothetical protein
VVCAPQLSSSWLNLGLGIILIQGKMTSVKYYYELLGFATDEPNRSCYGNLLLGLVEPKPGPLGKVKIIFQQRG